MAPGVVLVISETCYCYRYTSCWAATRL